MLKYLLALTMFVNFSSIEALAHCQIPCGVYGDEARFEEILENILTIEKAMNKINSDDLDAASLTRWVITKEEHAQKIQDIAAEYFLTQRVKTPKPTKIDGERKAYHKHLELLHKIIVFAMKAKQTTDLKYVESLKELTNAYKEHYLKNHAH